MFEEQRLGNDGTEAYRPCKPDDGDDQRKEKDDDIAHPGMVSKPEKTLNFSPIQQFAMDRPRTGEISLMAPALLRDDRVMVNLKQGGGADRGLGGNPAIAVFAPPEDLFIFALEPFEGATACEVLFGRAEFRLESNNYTLFSERPILSEDHQSKIWVLRVKYVPSKVEQGGVDGKGWVQPGELSDLLTQLKVKGIVSHH